MAKPILPDSLREKIMNLFGQGLSSVDIYDAVIEESKPYLKSHEQLLRCISSIKGKFTLKSKRAKGEPIQVKKFKVPKPKKFNVTKHQHIVKQLSTSMIEKDFENLCEDIVIDILKNYEKFKSIENANVNHNFHNPPFDFFAYKGGKPFIIEFKGSLNNYNAPGETQKRRLKELLKRIKNLNIALLQVKLNPGEYRIFYNDDMNLFFDGKKISLSPVVKWINTKIVTHLK